MIKWNAFRLALLCFAIVYSIEINAQSIHFGLFSEVGPSWTANKTIIKNDRPPGLSTNVGVWARSQFSERSMAELGVSYFRHIDRIVRKDRPLIGPMGEDWGVFSSEDRLVSNYLAMALLYDYSLSDRLHVASGVRAGLLLRAVSHYEAEGFVGQSPREAKSKQTVEGERFDAGLKARLLYDLTDRIAVGLSYYHGFVDLSETHSIVFFGRMNRAAAVSMHYSFGADSLPEEND